MKALTLTQPWATLVILGVKRIETRGWATPYRGRIAIHAAKGWRRDDIEFAFDLASRDILPLALHAEPDTDLPRGVVLGTVELVGCYRLPAEGWPAIQHVGSPEWPVTAIERELGDYSPDRYGWLLRDPRPFREPIPARGALGLWEWSR